MERRLVELANLKPDEIIQQVDSRTIAASPLPYNVKLEDVQSFFTNYAKVNSVRLPRNVVNKKHFCGTALVEFSKEEEAKSIMDNALVFAGANMEIRPKKEFDAEHESKKEAYEKIRPRKDNQDEGCSYQKGLIVAFKMKKTAVDSVVQQDNIDEGNDSATKLEDLKALASAAHRSDPTRARASARAAWRGSARGPSVAGPYRGGPGTPQLLLMLRQLRRICCVVGCII